MAAKPPKPATASPTSSITAALAEAERELAALYAQRDTTEARIAQVEPAVAALRQLTGAAPAPRVRRHRAATGTKADILDVLADGKRRTSKALAEACKVKANAIRRHLQELVEAGDVDAQGSTWTRTYGIP